MEVSESNITELFIYLFVCRMLRYFLAGDCVALFVYLGNC